MNEALDFLPARVPLRDWREFRTQDFGHFGADGVVIALPKPLAGLGTRRQLDGLALGMAELFADGAPRLAYVGPPIPDGPPLLATPLAAVPASDSVEDTYRKCTEAFTSAFEHLAKMGCERLVVVAMGYTAFGPEAARRALEATSHRGIRELLVLVVDSAFPDRDRREHEVGADGYPTTRFYEPAYRCGEDVTVVFLLTSAYLYDTRLLATRRPAGCPVGLIAPPYTASYIDGLASSAARGSEKGPSGLVWLDIPSWSPQDLLIPFVSSDIWSPSAVGAWMQPGEYETVVQGTDMMLSGLAEIAKRRNCRVFVPIDSAVSKVVDIDNHSAIIGPADGGPGVILLPYCQLPQTAHAEMLGAANVAISRTGAQANSSVVLALAGTPSIVLDLPAAGYMQAELCSAALEFDVSVGGDGTVEARPRNAPLGWLARWNWSSSRFAASVETTIADPIAANGRASSARQAFDSLRRAEDHDLFAILSRLVRQG